MTWQNMFTQQFLYQKIRVCILYSSQILMTVQPAGTISLMLMKKLLILFLLWILLIQKNKEQNYVTGTRKNLHD